jgi:hypothetical protein
MSSSPSALSDLINDINHATFYATSVYAFNASGGFQMERFFDPSFYPFDVIPRFDVTDSLQVLFDVATFNAKLGLVKNSTNDAVVSSTFNEVTDVFTDSNGNEINTITITADDFKNGFNMDGKQIISVGKYATLYSDFKRYVGSYFGYYGGFSSLFAAASEFNIDINNVFNGASFVRLLNGETKASTGCYIKDLSGSITISNITRQLRFAIDTNCFGNRIPGSIDPTTGYYVDGSGTAVDPSYNNNYGLEDGFIAGDLIWVPTGTKITLILDIDSEAFLPINNVGPGLAAANYSQTTVFSGDNFSQTTDATTNRITRTVQAPLLIKLADASTIAAL